MTSSRMLMLILIAAVCVAGVGVGAADEVNVTLEGRFGGATYACAVSGNCACIGQGQDIVVLDVSSPASPVGLGRVTVTTGRVRGVAVSGDCAYVADGGLVIVDITDKSAPVLAGGYDTAGYAYGVAVSGDYAYVADGSNGLVIVDITDKSAPVLAGGYNTAGSAKGVAVLGDYAYVADWDNGLVIMDITDKSAPVLAGGYGTADAQDVAVSGDYAYVADGTGLVIVDITDKSSPTLAGNNAVDAYGVAVSGDYAYVAEYYNGLVIVDITDKSEPVLAGGYDTTGSADGVAVSGDYAYVADGSNGLVIVDVTDKLAPVLAGGYNTTVDTRDVAVSGDYVYAVDGGLVIVDITDKSAPAFAGGYATTGYARGVAVSGDYAYVADQTNGLVIVDVTDKSAPVFAGGYDTEWAMGVAVSGDYAYVADGLEGLVIVDVTDSSAPTLAGGIAGSADGVAVSGDYAYVADGSNGLVIVDVTDKLAPVLVGGYDTERAEGVAVLDDYVYVADQTNGLVIVDVTDKSSPAFVGGYDTEWATSVAVSGDYAYVADGSNGLVIVDVTDKSAPVLAGGYDTAGYAYGVAVSGDYAYVADGSKGFVILCTDAPSTGLAHNINKGTNYFTIQAAIDDADIGDDIHVDSGTYYENVVVNKQLILRGIDTGAGMPVVDAGGSGSAITINADEVILEGFLATNPGTKFNSGDVNNDVGIKLIFSSNNVIANNKVLDCPRGIYLYWSHNNKLSDNTVLDQNALSSSYKTGILLRVSFRNEISGNVVSKNDDLFGNGISLYDSRENKLIKNNLTNNLDGIHFAWSEVNTIINNNISNNRNGIYLFASNDNILYHNDLVNNIRNACDNYDWAYPGANQWDSGTEGNHYGGDYTGTDSDGDGIGDDPHPIPGGSSEDRYPLMAPYSPPTGLQDRSLVQVEGQPEVYWFQNGRLYWVTDWNVINAMSGVPGWGSVNTLPASEFNPAGYLQGPRFITTGAESDGLLIMEQGHPEVYLISGGEKRHFTSPETLLWNGHSFDDVIDVSAAIIGMFPSGSDISITQAIIDKYHAQGGEATFGTPAGTGEQLGYPDSSGVVCSYVNFQNGAIECFTSGDYAGNAYAILNPFFDKWASMGYGKSVLGYPISDMSDVQTSSFGTPSRYQKFINGTEKGSLEYNLTSGEVFEIHGAIYAKWSAMGYSNSILGLVTSDEREAVQSFKGTTGRVSDFEDGHLHWHRSGEHEGVTYMTYGELDEVYTSTMSGTASWLGFPVMDQEDIGGHGYCEFEGGYIEWDDVSGEYKALPYEFSVKITSPENDDIFSKKSGVITFRAEVSGGTPEFTYTWTLDGRTQVDNTNERSSEWTLPGSVLGVGEHRVKLQVEDAQGNTAESDEIGFEVFDKLVAIIPIEFDDLKSQESTDNLKTKADLVVRYYENQSYNQENIGYKIFENNNDWYHISEKYNDIQNGQYQNQNVINNFHPFTTITSDWYMWGIAMQEAGLQINIPQNPDWSLVRPIGFDAGMVVIPEISRPCAIVNPEGSGAAWVDAIRGYGSWAHELGHALYGFRDMAGDEPYGGNIGYWGLMGLGYGMNPPTPVIGYNKNRSGWISYNDISYSEIIGSSKEYSIHYLDDTNLKNEGLLRFNTNPYSSQVDYYIFEGRYERDGVSLDKSLDPDYELFPTDNKGISIYHVKDGKIFRDPISYFDISPHEISERWYAVTLSPGHIRYIHPENIKLTPFMDTNQLKLNIEEFIPEWIRIWEIKASIPSGGGGGGAGVPIENNLDVDLHMVSLDGKKVGMNYSAGEYYVQIKGANTSGNIASGGYEWISVPINIGAEAYVDLTPELKELLRNNNSINVEVISTFITYDGSGNRMESNPITVNINSESVDSPLILSLPINITFLPPITTMEQFNLTDGRTLPIKFTVRNSSTNEFIYDDTVNVTITNSTGHLIAFFTNGTGTDSVRINSTEEQYIVNFHTKDYDLNVGETYTIHVTFGEADDLRGYAITHFTLVDLNN